jgi:cyclopropane-fatty-acyl-phospholipid synthase
VHESDYLGGDGALRPRLESRLREAGVDEAPARIVLITCPRVFGHAFNPVSFYYCYDSEGASLAHVAEVNNTFGQGHVYVLPRTGARPTATAKQAGAATCYRADKEFHVSPFNDVDGRYDFRFAPLGDRLDVAIDLSVDDAPRLATGLRGESRPLTDATLLRALLRRPFTMALTIPRILRQAASLYLRHRLEFRPQPEPSSPRTFQGTRPAYIREFRLPAALERWFRPQASSRGQNK